MRVLPDRILDLPGLEPAVNHIHQDVVDLDATVAPALGDQLSRFSNTYLDVESEKVTPVPHAGYPDLIGG